MAILKRLYRSLHYRTGLLGFIVMLLTLVVSGYILMATSYTRFNYDTAKDMIHTEGVSIFHRQERRLTLAKSIFMSSSKATTYNTKTKVSQSNAEKTTVTRKPKSRPPIATRKHTIAEVPVTFKKQSLPPVANEPRPNCIDYRILRRKHVKREKISCVPHKPSDAACKFAQELYYRDDNLKSCGYTRKVEICKLSDSNKNRDNNLFHCSFDDCKKYKRDNVTIWAGVNNGDEIESQGEFSDLEKLEAAISREAKRAKKEGTNFLFLECSDEKKDRKKYDSITQLFILPPNEIEAKTKKSKTSTNPKKHINVNIVLIDSAARSHFYRSLPTVIERFDKINKDKKQGTEILDFELFQSIEGHTAENLHALFTGGLFPKHWTGSERENVAIGADQFFNTFAKAGYNTFYQDDLCYSDWWGMRMDMGSQRSWSDFVKKIKESGIDHAGLTHASCRILRHNNVTNPFAGPDGPLCFNGRFQDAYYLDFASSRHLYASKRGLPLVSYTALNVAHDHTGRRIQSVDYELANFATEMTKSKNTITIIMADHGNTYAHYTHAIMEGRFEQFHPSFFMILPSNVQKMLGKDIVHNLRQNQKKLVTMLDIHDALVNIPAKVAPTGIFSHVPVNRTCDDLDLRLPNLCVCEGWDAETLNNSRHAGVASFAVGSLNNKILDYQRKIREAGNIPKCQRLIPTGFDNIRERNYGGTLITSLDFHTKSGRGADHDIDIFHVELQLSIDPKLTSFNMKMLSFDRVSKYGPYRVCGDKGIDMRLCVCDMTEIKENTIPIETFVLSELSPKRSLLAPSNVDIEHKHKISTCLYFKTISIPELSEANSIFSRSYEVANVCKSDMNLRIKLTLDNMKSTNSNTFEVYVSAYSVTYLGEAIRNVPYWNSVVDTINYSIQPPIRPKT